MAKTEVYSWRLERSIKMALEEEARRQGLTLAELLDRTAQHILDQSRRKRDDDAEQARLQAIAAKYKGVFSGGDPFASESVTEVVRKRIRARNAH